MNNPKYLIFDFDGTLGDTFTMSVDIIKEILPKKYLDQIDLTKINTYKDLSARDLKNLIHLKAWRIPFLLFRARHEMYKRVKEIKPIKGIPEVLKVLHEKNIKMYVISTNSKRIINSFLTINNLSMYFDKILSTRLLFGKNRVITKIISNEKLNREFTFYVGDEVRDIEACNISGIKCISVTWGFNSRDILLKHSTYKVINSPMELLDIVG